MRYLSRLSLTKLLISSKVSILVIVDSSIKSREKKKVFKYKLPKFKQSFKLLQYQH